MENPVTKKIREVLLSAPSLGLLVGSAASLGLALSGQPAFIFGTSAGLGAWVFYVYNALARPSAPAGYDEGARRRAVEEVERALNEIAHQVRVTRRVNVSAEYQQRVRQLRRIVELERTIARDLQRTPGTINVLPADIQEEVRHFVDRAIEVSLLRIGLLRAYVRTNEAQLEQELETLRQRAARVAASARGDLELALQAKTEQLAAFRRLRSDLVALEAQLDAIESFLNTITYQQGLSIGGVREQMGALKSKIEARRQSAEEVARLVREAGGG